MTISNQSLKLLKVIQATQQLQSLMTPEEKLLYPILDHCADLIDDLQLTVEGN